MAKKKDELQPEGQPDSGKSEIPAWALAAVSESTNLTEKSLEVKLNDVRRIIDNGEYAKAITILSDLLTNTEAADQKIDILLVKGMAERMIQEPRMYAEAIADLTLAIRLARETNNTSKLLDALSSLLDAYRTSIRDPKFKEVQLQLASVKLLVRDEIAQLLKDSSLDDSPLERLNAFMNLGLFELQTDVNSALAYYAHARPLVDKLISSAHPQALDRLNRLININSAAFLKLPDDEFREQADEVLEQEIARHQEFVTAKHQRGAGDSANVIGDYKMRLGNQEEAKKWYTVAREIAENTSGIYGGIDQDVLKDANERLAKLTTA